MNPDDDTLREWYAKLEARPAHPPAVMGLTNTLIALDRPDDILALARDVAESNHNLGDSVLRMSFRALPAHFELIETYCNLPEERGDPMQTNARWSLVRRTQAKRLEAHVGYIYAMLRQHREAEADRALKSAFLFFGLKLDLREAQARIAEAAGQWEGAAAMWGAIARDFPDHPEATDNQIIAEQRAAEGAPGTGQAAHALPVDPVRPEDRDELKKLVTGFESLGHNCEFGLMQRHFGAEPLGLLRFSFTLPMVLTSLLNSRFEGLGDPHAMLLKDDGRDYMLRHVYSSWAMHTRIRPGPEVDTDKLLRDQCRHTSFLRKKLLKDLAEQNKIFVYWRADLSEKDIDLLDQAVQSYGPNMLLCVRLSDATHPSGSYEWRGERLMVAALDRPGNAFRGASWNISYDHWVHFCRIAAARWAQLRAAAPHEIAEPLPA